DLVAQIAGMFLSELNEKQRYTDPDLSAKERKLSVSPSAATRTRAVFNNVWKVTPELAARCLGSVTTMPKLLLRQEVSALSEHNVTQRLAAKRGLYHRKGSRWT